MISYLKDFFSLIFPKLCLSCGIGLTKHENCICLLCLHQFPYTNYHLEPDNKLMKQFWGRVDISAAAAYLYFKKGSKVQALMHQLKYHNQPELGIEIGRLYGKELIKVDAYRDADIIIPVPLHKTRQKKRGYNQSEQFAIGLSESMGISVDCNILLREHASETQVSKSRFNRYKNMEDIFTANPLLLYKNILLVDDTITTGATLEACVLALQKVGLLNIKIAGIAFTE
jgi:ComF family protein